MSKKNTHKIKCPNCKSWNTYQDYCENCNQPISNEKLIEISNKKDFEKLKNKPKDSIDILLEKLKNHRFFLVRILYTIVYSIAMTVSFIVGIIGFMVAFLNG